MTDYQALKKQADELADRRWDTRGIEARIKTLTTNNIPRKKLDPQKLKADRENILDNVQKLAEENNFFLKNCAQATALALMEEFGLGNMEIIRGLTPFPSIAGTGKFCGGVTGSLIALGLFFGPETPPDFEKMNRTILLGQEFLDRFEEAVGHLFCSDIIKTVIIGRALNPGESEAAMAEFSEEKGFERCGLPPGIGARLTADLIMDSLD
jgi:C_GCAxxG_C_C family probable redox protein